MNPNIRLQPRQDDSRQRIAVRFSLVSEFVFGTNNAAFVQVMYEQYLRDPASVSEEWRGLFDNGKLAELPVIPTSRDEAMREEGRGKGEGDNTPTASPGITLP